MIEADILKMIQDEIEESLTLEYKGAGSLGRTDGKRGEIAKDVSAFANSAGGRLIYGVLEYDEPDQRHKPEKVDPIDGTTFSKEWLEQVINNVQPRLDGVVITPVRLQDGGTVYVVDIPQSATAHQSTDGRYYRRYNFQSVRMADHEIRDVMNRDVNPMVTIQLSWRHIVDRTQVGFPPRDETVDKYRLDVWAHNTGRRMAQYITAFVSVPNGWIGLEPHTGVTNHFANDHEYAQTRHDNTRRDVTGMDRDAFMPRAQYGPSWYQPVLPGLQSRLGAVDLVADRDELEDAHLPILWSISADDAPQRKGQIILADLEDG